MEKWVVKILHGVWSVASMRASVKEWMVQGVAFCRSWLREEWATLLSTTVRTALVCFALVALVVPYKFAGAGVTGIALITHYLWNMC